MKPKSPSPNSDFNSSQAPVRLVELQVGERRYRLPTPGPAGVTSLDAGAVDFAARLQQELGDAPVQVLQSLAATMVREGIAARQRSELVDAFLHVRIALWCALRLADPVGLDAVTANLLVIRETARDVLERALGPLRDPNATPAEQEALARWEASLDSLLDSIRGDAKAWLPLAESFLAVVETRPDPHALAATLHGLHRLASMAGQGTRRDQFGDGLDDLAATSGRWDEALESAFEAICDLGSEEDEKLIQLLQGAAPAEVLRHSRLRTRLAQASKPKGVATASAMALRHLAALRLRMTAGGGPSGHVLSYRLAPVLHAVGRDLVAVLIDQGDFQGAFEYTEWLRARALTDRMGRAHPHRRHPREFRAAIRSFTGSVNAVEPVRFPEIAALARETNTALLAYVDLPARAPVAWLVTPEGELLSQPLADPANLLRLLVARLPYLDEPSRDFESAHELAVLNRILSELYDVLIPESFQEPMNTADRVAILADGLLEVVPFAALRSPAGRWLIEDHELIFWPSVTAWLVANDSLSVRATPTCRALVLARERFAQEADFANDSEAGSVVPRLSPLPGAVAEARVIAQLLGVSPFLDDQATWAAVLSHARGIGVVHLATHAVQVVDHPGRSFLALADGPLIAEEIYLRDLGVRANLIVLSGCQTSLGAAHSDSTISLANAMIVAGSSTVVSALWQVYDVETAEWMVAFYRELSNGASVPSAVAAAQRQLAADPRPEVAHPVAWAGFRVTGHGANPFEPNP